ncbi:hypothetical protein SDC9_115628 [bioreactor metagenome]|uniref:Uncharacterized protein n=1 Tax=bioreactor metagenome TaxID=1076179 RepID=A0A645C413_9ZZZZ
MGEICPVAILRADVVCICADDRDFSNSFVQRQHTVVFQQRDAFPRGKKRAEPVLRAAEAVRRAAILRPLKQPHRNLDAQDIPDRLIQHALVQRAALHEANRALVKCGRGHHHIVSRAGCKQSGFVDVFCDKLLPHEARNVVPIRHNEARKAEFAAQNLPHRPLTRGKRRAVDGAIGGHNRRHTRLHRAPKRRQKRLLEFTKRHLGVAGIPPADGVAIADIVLCAG